MNRLLIRIYPAAGSLPTAITETTAMARRGGGKTVMRGYWTSVTAKDGEMCKERQRVSKSENGVWLGKCIAWEWQQERLMALTDGYVWAHCGNKQGASSDVFPIGNAMGLLDKVRSSEQVWSLRMSVPDMFHATAEPKCWNTCCL